MKVQAPWDFVGGYDGEGEAILNVPTLEGRLLGAEIARLTPENDGCDECAFRLGAEANGCLATVMDALKCVVEGVPFYCHINDGLCQGYLASRASVKAETE